MTQHTDLATIREDFRATLTALEAALAEPAMLEDAAFVVVGAIGPLTFTREALPGGTAEGKTFARTTGTAPAHLANRFTRADADRLAQATGGTARHWTDAARAQAATLRKSLGILDALPCETFAGAHA